MFAGDLTQASVVRRWPLFTGHAVDLGVHAAFAFPLRIGAINLGVLSLFASAPTQLREEDVSRALRLSSAAAYAMLGLFTDPEATDGDGRCRGPSRPGPPRSTGNRSTPTTPPCIGPRYIRHREW